MTVDLEKEFATYFEELERCKKGHCYWALLHLLVILPDICAALETDDGEAGNGGPYRKWCKRHFDRNRKFTPEDRYAVRCMLLHQGRTVTGKGQYESYSFVPTGDNLHLRTQDFGPGQGINVTLVVSRMAEETVQAIRSWFAALQKAENVRHLENVKKHIRWLVQEGKKIVPGTIVTVPTTSSTGGFSS